MASARAGGACFGFAVLGTSVDAEIVLAALALGLLVVGGTAWTWWRGEVVMVRLFALLAVVIVVRWLGGTAAAAVAAVLLALGAWVRIRPAEAVTGLAVFGGAVALLGRASLATVGGFWLLGVAMVLARVLVVRVRRRFSPRASLSAEKEPTIPSPF